MKEPITHSYQIMQIMQIMNELRRLSADGEFEKSISGMSVPQLACIGYLTYYKDNEDLPVYQRDLETCFKLRRSTISSLLTTLEKKGLILRVPVAHDARLKRLVLTEAGKDLGDRVMGHFTGLNSILVSNLDEEERETLHRILEKVELGLASRCP